MSQIIKSEAIILKNIALSGSSRYIITFSKELGKVTLIAKGIKKPTSCFGACLEPFTYSQVIFYYKEQRENYYISGCDIINPFLALRQDLEKIYFASAVSGLINQVVPPEEKNVAIFNLIFSMFTELDRSKVAEIAILYFAFQIKLLTLIGFKPILDRCANCNNEINLKTAIYFLAEEGGLICKKCMKRSGANPIDASIVNILRHFLTEKFSKNKKWRINETVERQLADLLRTFIEFHIEKPIQVLPKTYKKGQDYA